MAFLEHRKRLRNPEPNEPLGSNGAVQRPRQAIRDRSADPSRVAAGILPAVESGFQPDGRKRAACGQPREIQEHFPAQTVLGGKRQPGRLPICATMTAGLNIDAAVCRPLRQPGWRPRDSHGRRRLLWLALLITLVSLVPRGLGQVSKEYDLKATFLYNFAQFVDWPPEAFPGAENPLVIGILGEDPFGQTLDDIVKNEVVKDRKLVVQRYQRVEEINTCHILFISRSEGARLPQILSSLKGRTILTVGETDGFATQGGIVRLIMEKNRIRLRINIDAAKASKLTISSKVLRAAEVVGAGGAGR